MFLHVGENVRSPVGLWLVGLVAGLAGVVWGAFDGSLIGFSLSTTATVVAIGCLFLNRRRQMDPNFDHSKPWFHKAVSSLYWVSVVGSLVHIVRYAIEVASS